MVLCPSFPLRRAHIHRTTRIGQVRDLLCGHGVPTVLFVPYYNFGTHIDKLVREHDDKTMMYLVRMAVDKWTAQGLDTAVLNDICWNLYNIKLESD